MKWRSLVGGESELSDINLGKIIDGTTQQRDAIHIAVAPVIAVEGLMPGQHIALTGEGQETVGLGTDERPAIGIVDPFLKFPIRPGERFWMFLYPNTITSLRHEWSHPAFSAIKAATEGSQAWIEAFAAEMDQTYSRLMGAAQRWVEYEDYTRDDEEGYKSVDYAKWPIFWKHYEIVTGTKVKDHEATFFTCSC